MTRSSLPTLAFALLAAFAGLAAGCDRSSPSEPDNRDSLTLASVTPAAGTKLAPGAAVTLTAAVDYQLRSQSLLGGDRGILAMDVEDQNNRVLDSEVRKTVFHGSGSTSLADHLVVPATGVTQVKVVLTLIPDAVGAATVETVAATYPVGP